MVARCFLLKYLAPNDITGIKKAIFEMMKFLTSSLFSAIK